MLKDKAVIKTMAGLSCLILVVGCGLIWAFVKSRHTVADDVLAISKMGVPTSTTALDSLKPVAGSDATPFYKKFGRAMDAMSLPAFFDLKRFTSRKAFLYPREQQRIANEFRGSAQLLIEGSKRDRWPLSDSQFDQNSTWSGVGLLARMADADELAGKTPLALQELLASLRVVDQANANRIHEGAWHLAPTYEAYAHIISRHKNDSKTLEKIYHDLSTIPRYVTVRDLLVEAFNQDIAAYKADWYPDKELQKTPFSQAKGELIDARSYKRLLARDVGLWKKILEELPSDFNDREGAIEVVIQTLKHAPPPPKDTWTSLREAPYYIDDATGYLAEKRALTCATQILITRCKTGSLPKTLPDFGMDSIDPFTNKPLKYQIAASGFKIYSVGSNRVDDGGIPGRPTLAPSPSDLVYQF